LSACAASAGIAAILPLLLGCANPGPPKPPSLHLPRVATQLSAERVGDHVLLSWTTPAETTDGALLRGPVSALVCRDDAPKPPLAQAQPVEPCRPVHQIVVSAGRSSATDTLPAALTSGPAALIGYRIELFNERGHSAGPSSPAYAAAGAAPAPAGRLQVAPQRNGVLVTWQPSQATPFAPMQLERSLLATAAGPITAGRKKSKLTPAPLQPGGKQGATPPQATLIADTHDSSDPGGMLDSGIHDGDTVTYTAQRARTVRLTIPPAFTTSRKGKRVESKASEAAFELRGEPSPPATIAFHDTFPPSVPAGLAAVEGGGFGEHASIDLSWEPNPELDLLGYNIYRADAGENPAFVRLNADPAAGAAYRDRSAQAGHAYLYRVTAVDQRHNESAPSQAVAANLHP
jgi:hypothetical protein